MNEDEKGMVKTVSFFRFKIINLFVHLIPFTEKTREVTINIQKFNFPRDII